MIDTRSEDCLIFYGLSPDLTKIGQVRKVIAEFMSQKQGIDPSDRFNFIAFQEDGPSYLDQFTLDPELVNKALKFLDNYLSRANIAGGIFVAVTFIIDVFKTISEKTFRLIIITDDESYRIPPHYIPALEDLIEKVKDMPFFIDVIRIDGYNVEEGKNLARLAAKTNGKFYDIEKIKELSSILFKLSKKKRIKKPTYYSNKKRNIIEENKPFYVNLADEPKVITKMSTCAICFQKDDTGIVQCPTCETTAHMTCWAQWAKTSNIGIRYVFRCHICYNILKLDYKFVLDVHAGRIPTREQILKLQKRDIVKYMQSLESKEKPKVIHVADPIAIAPEVRKARQKEVKNERKKERKTRVKVVICSNCSSITTSKKKICPNCNFDLF